MKKFFKLFIVVLAACVVAFVLYVENYYHVVDLDNAIQDSETVKITKIDNGYFYDGPGEDTACIFYPGAKVEDVAYGSLLKSLASNGIDCFLVHMPCNLAFLGKDRADSILESYNYDHYYLAGHSLGGAMMASYVEDHDKDYDGIIFLAAYSTNDLSKSHLRILSIYGSKDKVLNIDKVVDGRKYMPDDYEEFIIEGGNHGQFGDYGHQSGDGNASISSDKQKEITVEKIVEFCTN